MKRLLLISAVIFASVQLKASHLASEFVLKLQDQSWFTVTIGHRHYNNPVTKFRLNNIEPGSHYMTVTRVGNFHYAPQVVFSGFIDIPFRSRVVATIDRNFRFRVNNIVALAPAPVHHPYPYVYPAPVIYGMSEVEFHQLTNTINNMSFESSKINVIKQALHSHHFTSMQVATLMRMMSFDSSKLEIAKIAYAKTVDQQNYYLLNNEFSFESSIEELNEFIYRG